MSAAANSETGGAASGQPKRPPVASGALPLLGHLLELRRNPLAMMQRVHDECGEAGVIDLAGNPITMFYGAKDLSGET